MTHAGEIVLAHDFMGPGWIHPLTGVDHMLAMLAVGAWSAILGGRAIWVVPSAFVTAMGIGAGVGLAGGHVPGVEVMIAASVLLLGVTIAAYVGAGRALGAVGVALFGFCHGIAHGAAYGTHESRPTYLVGILATTACLHVVGAIGTIVILGTDRGRSVMRLLGTATAVAGVVLVFRAA
ncbi:MAG: HupE/UreJ family protein [Blastococcus sp.]